MFESIAHAPLGFWLVAAMVTLIDSSILLPPGHFAFSIERGLAVRVRVAHTPFLLRGKELVVTLIAFPFRIFFISSTFAPRQSRTVLKKLIVRGKYLRREVEILATLSFCMVLLTWLVGPGIALQYGIERSLLVTLPAIYTIAISSIIVLCLNRKKYELANADLARVASELFLCPFLSANLIKKIVIHQKWKPNTSDLVEYFVSDKNVTAQRIEAQLDLVGGTSGTPAS